MADLQEGLFRAIAYQQELGTLLGVVGQGMPWKCCVSAAKDGPAACICWEPVFDQEQSKPDLGAVAAIVLGTAQPPERERMCGDCAYRAGSPERTGRDEVDGDETLLDRLAASGERFWCHDGMRSPVAWRHPKGMRIPAVGDGDYQPVIVEGVPYRANGEPGLLCAGWAARRRWHEQRAVAHG